ncbi:MAG: DNA polymerase I [Anaerolineae bacterium]
MTQRQRTLILIDGHALAYRAYFGMPDTFSTAAGEKTNAVYGFTSMLLAVWKEFEPDYFIVTFDKGDTFRHKMYGEYKGTREKMADDLRSQIGRIEQLVRAFNMPVYVKEGFEADDLLGTLANQAAEQGILALIVTGDRDTFQLVRPNIKVVISGRRFEDRQVYDEAAVQARYGLPPHKLVDLKALTGDSSDNIPGVRGIGDKGGAKLLQQFDTLDGIYANLSQLPAGTRAKLEAGRDNAYLSRELGRIVTTVPGVTLKLDEGRTTDFDLVNVANLFVELEFNTIFNRIPGAPADKTPQQLATIRPAGRPGPIEPDGEYSTVDSQVALLTLTAQLRQSNRLSVDVETDSTNETQTNLVGIAITPVPRRGYYIPVGHGLQPLTAQQASMFKPGASQNAPPQLSLSAVQQALAPILADPGITKYMHNAKFDMAVLQRHGMPVAPPIFDSMVASWLGNNAPEARHGLKDLALSELNIKMTPIKTLIGSGKKQITMAQVPIEQATPYAAADVDMTLRLADTLEARLKTGNGQVWTIFQEIELPLITVLKDMELAGITVDVAVMDDISAKLTSRLAELEAEIHAQAQQPFNINSTQQLSDVLFKRLKLPTAGLKKTKSGHYSTAAGVLEELSGRHPIIDLILEHRSLKKLLSTYVEAIPRLVNPVTGRVHTSYNQIGISTGRLSSADPNLQNIPIRTAQGREIRRAFVAPSGWKLVAADYSQVELRILAHIADDPGLKAAFANDEDIHAATAAAVLGVPLNEVTKDQRRIAKAVNFGLAYGQGAFGLSRSTGMSRDEAQTFINTYFENYPGVKRYIDHTKQQAAEQGYTETLLGRRRDFSRLADLTGPQRARAEREAINMPIQGSAADIIKLAMNTLHRALQAQRLQAKMLLQVHDELVLEAPDAELPAVVSLVRQVMAQAYPLSVPLKVDVEVGQNWLEMEIYPPE